MASCSSAIRQTVWTLFLALLFAVGAVAHPNHSSFAEINVNYDSNTLEVALRLTPEDLEHALTEFHGRRIVLRGDDKDIAWVMPYLQANFRIENPLSLVREPRLIGHEVAHAGAWFYLEYDIDTALGVNLDNTLLQEWSPAQTNQVKFIDGDKRSNLVFYSGDPAKTLKP